MIKYIQQYQLSLVGVYKKTDEIELQIKLACVKQARMQINV